MIELAFGAAHPEWPNSIVGEQLGASTGIGGMLPKQVLAFRKDFGRPEVVMTVLGLILEFGRTRREICVRGGNVLSVPFDLVSTHEESPR
jgi:hypothetical protein